MEVLVETIAFEPNREDLLEHYSVKLMEVRQWAIAEREKKEKKSHG